jgi:hypothetical protein
MRLRRFPFSLTTTQREYIRAVNRLTAFWPNFGYYDHESAAAFSEAFPPGSCRARHRRGAGRGSFALQTQCLR